MSTPVKEIAVIEKSRSEDLHLSINEFKSHRYLDLRIYCEPYSSKDGGRVPTKRGITVPLDKIGELIAALEGAQEAVNSLTDAPSAGQEQTNG